MRLSLILMSFFFALGACAAPVQLILDTDIGPDYDDVGAVAIMHALSDRGEAEILATVSCNLSPLTVPTIEILNSYYGRPDIPVGSVAKDGPCESGDKESQTWAKLLKEKYKEGYRHQKAQDAPDAVQIYRQVLARMPDHSVTIVTLGFFTNLKNLLLSKPDQNSPLDGKQLVQKKVKHLVSMVGRFPKGREYNAMIDSIATRIVFESWPTPILCSGYEIGSNILTGKRLIAMPGQNNPVKDVYAFMMAHRSSDKEGRMSWDETAVLVAVRGPAAYFDVERGRILMDDRGTSAWQADPQGPHSRLLPKTPWAQVGKVIEDLMMAKPKNQKAN